MTFGRFAECTGNRAIEFLAQAEIVVDQSLREPGQSDGLSVGRPPPTGSIPKANSLSNDSWNDRRPNAR